MDRAGVVVTERCFTCHCPFSTNLQRAPSTSGSPQGRVLCTQEHVPSCWHCTGCSMPGPRSLQLPLTVPGAAPWPPWGLGCLVVYGKVRIPPPISETLAKATLSDNPRFIVLAEQLLRIQQHAKKYPESLCAPLMAMALLLGHFSKPGSLSLWISSPQRVSLDPCTELLPCHRMGSLSAHTD